MKNYKWILFFVVISLSSFAGQTSNGITGEIDFPNAYILRPNNYNASLIIDKINEGSDFGLMVQGTFVPQLEAGIKISENGGGGNMISRELLKSNLKFQIVPESANSNPAISIGFIESDSNDSVYGFIVASKRMFKKSLQTHFGFKYDDQKSKDLFLGMKFRMADRINLMTEFYSYEEVDISGDNDKKISFNIGGEFYTREKLYTKVFWREQNQEFGIMLTYIGIYR